MTNSPRQRATARIVARANFTTHGLRKHPLYATWKKNPRHSEYARYAGRGIRVCDRWGGSEGFPNFLADMGERPPGHTLDRRDNDGNYTPENCRWATGTEQALNRRLRQGSAPQVVVEEIRHQFATGGRTIASLAREHRLPRTTVSGLVHGPSRRSDT